MPFAPPRLAGRPHFPTAVEALDAAKEGETVVRLGGAFFVLPAGEADDLAAAGVRFARVRRVPFAGGTRVVTVPARDDA